MTVVQSRGGYNVTGMFKIIDASLVSIQGLHTASLHVKPFIHTETTVLQSNVVPVITKPESE